MPRSLAVPRCSSIPTPISAARSPRTLKEPRRIAVVAGHETWHHLADIEAALGRLVSETDGSYIGQHGLNMMKLTRGEAGDLTEEDLEALCDYITPGMNLGEFVRWSRVYGKGVL